MPVDKSMALYSKEKRENIRINLHSKHRALSESIQLPRLVCNSSNLQFGQGVRLKEVMILISSKGDSDTRALDIPPEDIRDTARVHTRPRKPPQLLIVSPPLRVPMETSLMATQIN